jgi:hypothetical protein
MTPDQLSAALDARLALHEAICAGQPLYLQVLAARRRLSALSGGLPTGKMSGIAVLELLHSLVTVEPS